MPLINDYNNIKYIEHNGNKITKIYDWWRTTHLYPWYVPPTGTFTVIWEDWDGTVLERDTNVEPWTIPHYDSENPTREWYTFIWRSPEIEPIDHDITYTAQYEETVEHNLNYDIRDSVYFWVWDEWWWTDHYAVRNHWRLCKVKLYDDEDNTKYRWYCVFRHLPSSDPNDDPYSYTIVTPITDETDTWEAFVTNQDSFIIYDEKKPQTHTYQFITGVEYYITYVTYIIDRCLWFRGYNSPRPPELGYSDFQELDTFLTSLQSNLPLWVFRNEPLLNSSHSGTYHFIVWKIWNVYHEITVTTETRPSTYYIIMYHIYEPTEYEGRVVLNSEYGLTYQQVTDLYNALMSTINTLEDNWRNYWTWLSVGALEDMIGVLEQYIQNQNT